MNPPDAASTCIGTSGPPGVAASASSAVFTSATGSYDPSMVDPRMNNTPTVVSSASAAGSVFTSATGSYDPSMVDPRMTTTPMVFSSHSAAASAAPRWYRPGTTGTYRGSTSQ